MQLDGPMIVAIFSIVGGLLLIYSVLSGRYKKYVARFTGEWDRGNFKPMRIKDFDVNGSPPSNDAHSKGR